MHSEVRIFKSIVVLGFTLLVCGASGCATFSASNAPIDCDVVKNQQKSGLSDTQIASNLGAPVDKVAACRGPETEGNKSAGMAPSTY